MADEAAQVVSTPATTATAVELSGAGSPQSPQVTSSDSVANPSPASAPSELSDKEAKKKAKKERDAKRAQVRRRLEDLENANSVEELEQKLLARLPTKTPPATVPASSPGAQVLALVPNAAAALPQAAAPGARPPPTPEQIKAWREATEQILGGLNNLAKLAVDAKSPLPLKDEELAELYKTAPPVLAKYLPDVMVSPELILASTILGIAVPRVLYALNLGPYAEQSPATAEAAPGGKAAA